jgi:hypothetical protein
MRVRLLILAVFVLGAGLGAIFASTSSGARVLKSCKDVERIAAPFVYTRLCGPAKAELTIDGVRYAFRGGECATTSQEEKPTFHVAIGYQKRHFIDLAKTSGRFLNLWIRPHRGDGRYRLDAIGGPADVTLVMSGVWTTDRHAGFVTVTGNGSRGRVSGLLYTAKPPNSNNYVTARATGSFTCR